MTSTQFEKISQIAHQEAGLVFPESKSSLVSSRLVKRLRALQLQDFNQYCDLVNSPDGAEEKRNMISALTTNISSFFRENHHFKTLAEDALPPLVARAKQGGRVRLWSAGSSVGMEAYSIAMTLLKQLPDAPKLDVKILASDIDTKVLGVGRQGRYDADQIEGVPPADRSSFFTEETHQGETMYQANDAMRSLVAFRELNLLKPWPVNGTFDIVFCRNTVIYFDDDTQRALWPRFQNAMAPDGWLFVGHSERVPEDSGTDFRTCGMTVYRRKAGETN